MRTLDPATAAGRRVLLVAPHPDDEALGCGGTVHLMARAGAEVDVVILARGDGGVDGLTPADGRQDESRQACEILGLHAPHFADLASAQLRDQPAWAAERLAAAFPTRRFDVLLVPSPLERHATHRASLSAALLAPVAAAEAVWWGYGVWDALPAVDDVAEVDISAARAAKTRAISAHSSQAGARALVAGMASRDLDQAVFSRITGQEERRAVERLMDLGDLPSRVRQAAAEARGAAREGSGQALEPAVAPVVSDWLRGRQELWTRALWGAD